MSDSDKKLEVYYDGSCPMCTVFADTVAHSSRGEKFDNRDVTKNNLPEGVTFEQVWREMYVVENGTQYRGADAVLRVMREYPRWRWLAKIGKLPVFNQIAHLIYRVVAANRHSLFGPLFRIHWTKIVVGLGFIAGIVLSFKLWVSSRSYPLTPVIDAVPPIPYPVDWGIVLVLLGLLAALLFSAKPKWLICGIVGISAQLMFFDQSRLQPWAYEYVFLLVVLGAFFWKPSESYKESVLDAGRIVVAFHYIWAGVQKVNAPFITDTFPWMITPIARFFPESMFGPFVLFGVLVPFIEIGIGVGLLSRRFRTIALVFAVAFAIFVLWTIGPYGHNWNSVVWPWNVVLPLLALILFARTPELSLRHILLPRGSYVKVIALVFFGILPLLCFFNKWDSLPSFALYSGNINYGTLYVTSDVWAELPDDVQHSYSYLNRQGTYTLDITSWAMGELNVPPYPEPRIFKSIARDICRYSTDPDDVLLTMSGRLVWANGVGPQTINCSQL